MRTSERCVCIQLHSEYTRIYLLKARRTLGVLETLLSLRLDTRSFPLMFSYSEAVYRLFPDIWTTVLGSRDTELRVLRSDPQSHRVSPYGHTGVHRGWPVESTSFSGGEGDR